MIGIASRFARMSGLDRSTGLRAAGGHNYGRSKIDGLTTLVREAAANSGNVTDVVWKAAQQAAGVMSKLAEAFAYLGLTVFTGYFLNYAQTDMDAS